MLENIKVGQTVKLINGGSEIVRDYKTINNEYIYLYFRGSYSPPVKYNIATGLVIDTGLIPIGMSIRKLVPMPIHWPSVPLGTCVSRKNELGYFVGIHPAKSGYLVVYFPERKTCIDIYKEEDFEIVKD